MLRKVPLVIDTPYVPGSPARPEQVLCPPKPPTRSIPDRGTPQRMLYCYTPMITVGGTWVEGQWVPPVIVVGPQTCIWVWGANLGQ